MVSSGLGNRHVAFKLGVSVHVVKWHLRNVFRKLSVTNRTELATIVHADRRVIEGALETREDGLAHLFDGREGAVLELLSDGKTNREIGQRLRLSPVTIGCILGAMYRKAGVRSRAQLVARAAPSRENRSFKSSRGVRRIAVDTGDRWSRTE